MMEHMMAGFPGVEYQFRSYVKKYAGAEKSDYFFNRFLDGFIDDADMKFLNNLGCTGFRVPFNYRHFENDLHPYKYNESGFKYLDKLLNLASKYKMYVILDMHTVPGHQNHDWHSDNNTTEKNLFIDGGYQQRFFSLWKYIADHYRNEEYIAGYDLMNEPVAEGAEEEKQLNAVYKNATMAIREVDKNHIVFLKGNMWGRYFKCFDEPFDDNIAYSPHHYSSELWQCDDYPGNSDLDLFTKGSIINQVDARDWFMKKYDVPCWIGEFGIDTDPDSPKREMNMRYLADLLGEYNNRGHSWSMWSYKDVGKCGTVCLKPDSPWMQFTEKTRNLKTRFRTDENRGDELMVARLLLEPELSQHVGRIKQTMMMAARRDISDILCDELGRKFAGLCYRDLDELGDSFRFENCYVRQPTADIIKANLT
jgi:aryl-phospho-beta-D-glucosidase BglC (GH1 family)